MGFVTNKWQPVSSPGPTPVPTWDLLAQDVKATTAFDFSSLDYTEYLIIVYGTYYSVPRYYEFFYIPEFGTIQQINGTAWHQYQTTHKFILLPQNTLKLNFSVFQKDISITSSCRYMIYGRKKAAWTLVNNNSSLPSYSELATANGYYTPFNYQVYEYRTSGGSTWSGSRVFYSSCGERIYQDAYTQYSGNNTVYTRLSSNEAPWTQIHSTNTSVSIADISYSEMFIVGRRMYFNISGSGSENCIQTLYVIPSMVKGQFPSGGYNQYQNGYYSGSYGSITISDTQVSAYYTFLLKGQPTNYFQSLDIYYR